MHIDNFSSLRINIDDTNNLTLPRSVPGYSLKHPEWEDEGESGSDQQTPNLKEIVQEITLREDWASGNSMVFLIEGEGVQRAESYDGSEEDAAKLIIKYRSIISEQTIKDTSDKKPVFPIQTSPTFPGDQ